MKQISYILLIVSLFYIVSCIDYQPAPYGKEFNDKRKEVGLKIIDSTFYQAQVPVIGYDNYPIKRKRKLEYVGLLGDIKSPAYMFKYSFLEKESGSLIFEEDIYASGKRRIGMSEGTIHELLICRYIFENFEGEYCNTTPYGFSKLDIAVDSIYGGNADLHVKFVKNSWEYIHTYPSIIQKVKISSSKPEQEFYFQKTDYLSKNQADSILVAWGLNDR